MIDRRTLIKNLARGFLPLLVFIAADEIFGLTAGLLTAIAFGIADTALIYFRERRIDRFLLFDTGLIVSLGLVSLLLHNDIFFKVKPVLVELILLALIGLTAFSDNPILLRMTGRYMQGISFSAEQVAAMRRMMRRLFWVILPHAALTAYAAFFLSTAAWGFISGGLFYLVLGGVMAAEVLKSYWQRRRLRRRLEGEEWFDLVNTDGKVIGRAPRSVVHGNPQLLHPVVHVHIVNSRGELFLQKRSEQKDLYPGRWDTAVGGHVSSGESVEHALHREAEEELGISMGDFRPLFRYIMRNSHESELVHAFLLRDEGPFYINHAEISEGRFWSPAEIEENLGRRLFTDNFEQEFQLLKKTVFSQSRRRA